ncbi:MAG: metallophosphoesterase [Treponema sp.]|nr:metallophosphoesterase [Treponema sp.]
MKIAIVSDIHQSVYWREVIEQMDDYDKVIFLGDEFDCWANKWPYQVNNAENIISFKKSFPEKVDLCWSNHAISYYLGERCSGYQSEHAFDIYEFYKKHEDFFNVIYIYDNWIFSHAGISEGWMKYCRINELNEINRIFKEKPDFFKWIGPDNFGNNANEGPLWIRPEALIANRVPGFNQAVGHTESVEPRTVKENGQIFLFCDTYEHNFLTVLDTEKNEAEFINLE